MHKRICKIPGCGKPEASRGWCRKHYTSWYRHGDPLFTEAELPPLTPGVYVITCVPNGWVYVGSSSRVRSRWVTHRSWLRNGTHNIPALQTDWDHYGEDAFDFALVTIIQDAEARYDAEQEHITAAMATGKCYNLSPSARDNTGHRFTREQGKKVSDGLRGKPKSAEHRANLWRDREVTPEFRELMRSNGAKGRGRPKPVETRRRMSEAQRSATTIRKLTADQVREIKKALASDESVRSLARQFGVTPGAISHIRAGRNWRHVT
jgi:group I intron endonuclease